jgi:hypothetical protein
MRVALPARIPANAVVRLQVGRAFTFMHWRGSR